MLLSKNLTSACTDHNTMAYVRKTIHTLVSLANFYPYSTPLNATPCSNQNQAIFAFQVTLIFFFKETGENWKHSQQCIIICLTFRRSPASQYSITKTGSSPAVRCFKSSGRWSPRTTFGWLRRNIMSHSWPHRERILSVMSVVCRHCLTAIFCPVSCQYKQVIFSTSNSQNNSGIITGDQSVFSGVSTSWFLRPNPFNAWFLIA